MRELGHPVRDEDGRACGTRFSYNSVYTWSQKLGELRHAAAKENKTRISKTRKGWFRNNKLVMHFHKRLVKAMRKARKNARKVTTAHLDFTKQRFSFDMGVYLGCFLPKLWAVNGRKPGNS